MKRQKWRSCFSQVKEKQMDFSLVNDIMGRNLTSEETKKTEKEDTAI